MPTFEETKFEAALAGLPKHDADLCCPRCGEAPELTVATHCGLYMYHIVECCEDCSLEAPNGIGDSENEAWRKYRLHVAAYIAEHGDRFGQCVRGDDVPSLLATLGAVLGSIVVFLAMMAGAVALVLALASYVMGLAQ
jgi:hypothetical protein